VIVHLVLHDWPLDCEARSPMTHAPEPALPQRSWLSTWLYGPYSALGLWLALATFVVDQAHKWWMLEIYEIKTKGRVAVTPFLDWAYVLNKGISYGGFQQETMTGQYALTAFAVAASLGLTIWLARGVDSRVLAASVGLLIGGALGNALDRVHTGGVIDYISLHGFGFYWYIFNIADMAIVAGVIGLLYDAVQSSRGDVAKSP
jgi:signal peptidase II